MERTMTSHHTNLRVVVLAALAATVSSVGLLAADLKISSPAFADKGQMAAKYSCDGEGVNPPLTFSNVPPRTQSLALIVEDPDIPEQFKSQIPSGVFDHWLIWDIAADSKGFAEGAEKRGINAAGQPGFFPACPPDRAHRYFFKLFALDKKLTGIAIKNKADLQGVMAGHIIQQAEMIGMYGPAAGGGRGR
jgi:Raf kinase inhibitor-like YbhB/YbcL family protein